MREEGLGLKIDQLNSQFEEDLEKSSSSNDLEDLRIKYLGRKSPVQALMQELRHVAAEDRPDMGKLINTLKVTIQERLESATETLKAQELKIRLEKEKVDISLPGRKRHMGRKHPVTQMLDKVLEIHKEMGFSVQYSSEIESEFYNYGGLNYPPDHPARDMQDTFYLDPETLLRSHTTNIQQHMFENAKPPIRICAPGKCYRNETISNRSHVLFHQVDGLYVDKGVTFADLLSTLETLYSKIMEEQVEIRVRPSYFPFVEPGMEVDIRCTSCSGSGCRLCKHTGWLEVCGAGMVHPNVLKAGGLDPEVYSGYAWGGGVERLVLLKNNVSDIRLFTENNLNFLSQF
ncbi:MAG: Phenylalanine--tRNA ligase alpha subunit [Chlamydiia bacterium]|nr:Phenylalanine--tRNA ligase alpha subunit [Chlamydiia bacterium]MCH9615448.1 Phenylalanine--tRNA ligase alpha subunit [Chlamydiia bacterium]MCH9628230.1 Phenylalanine--tRNA ligase alpha subunit [Chlamydiia bacterium]